MNNKGNNNSECCTKGCGKYYLKLVSFHDLCSLNVVLKHLGKFLAAATVQDRIKSQFFCMILYKLHR